MLCSSYDACGCSTQTTSTINLKRSTLHPHEGQADRPNTPSDSVNLRSNPGPPAKRLEASSINARVVSNLDRSKPGNRVVVEDLAMVLVLVLLPALEGVLGGTQAARVADTGIASFFEPNNL
jgi:hypothetical protein